MIEKNKVLGFFTRFSIFLQVNKCLVAARLCDAPQQEFRMATETPDNDVLS